ncbi:MAG: hypothetical protein NVSMB47_01940 [Polyangiales bacterium]
MSTHPHFDDRGLRWHTRYADALAEAKRDQKHVLVEYGRKACGNCKSLVEAVLPAIKDEVEEHFVLLATDCDAPEEPVRAIGARHMSKATALPFVLYLDSDGNFLYGTHGARPKDSLLHDLRHGRGEKHAH